MNFEISRLYTRGNFPGPHKKISFWMVEIKIRMNYQSISRYCYDQPSKMEVVSETFHFRW